MDHADDVSPHARFTGESVFEAPRPKAQPPGQRHPLPGCESIDVGVVFRMCAHGIHDSASAGLGAAGATGATDRLPLKIYRTFGRVEKLTSQSSRVWSSIHIRQT
jgi:hypothetical protein